LVADWVIKEHPDFFKDLDNLSKTDLEIFYKKKEKLKQNPERLKHLRGGANCYREPITKNIRLVYYIDGNIIWLLTIGPHDKAYQEYLKRLYSLREKYSKNQ
jgi:mRNA-degrading endonuclease RelE of RelBE toxin-antitoxin system